MYCHDPKESSEYHTKYIIAYQQKIEGIQQSDKIPSAQDNYISKSNSDLADKIYL